MAGTKGNKNAAGTRFRPTKKGSFLAHLDRLRTNPTARTHGAVTARRELRELRTHALDPTTVAAAVFREVRDDLLGSLAGAENLSTQEQWLVDEAAWTRLQLMHVNTWLAQQPELVNGKTKALLQVMVQKQSLTKTLAKILELLGLQRRQKEVGTLADYLRDREATPTTARPVDGAAQPGTREGQEP